MSEYYVVYTTSVSKLTVTNCKTNFPALPDPPIQPAPGRYIRALGYLTLFPPYIGGSLYRMCHGVLTPPEAACDGALATVAAYGIDQAIPRPESEIFEVERTCQPVLWSSSRASRAPCGVDSKTGAGKARF